MASKKKAADKKKVAAKKSKTNASRRRSTKNTAAEPKSVGTCFVMIPFKDPFSVYYEAIFKPAISEANLEPVRADDLFRPSVIVSDLWQMIQDATVLVAELTTKNANVFYELGLAHAIGKPVILVSETMDDVPFDLQQLRVLLYDKNDPTWGNKLAESITNAITETLENPVAAVPSIFRNTVESQAPEQDVTSARLDALESQIRMLRARQELVRHDLLPWEQELETVHGPDELDTWARIWHKRGIPISILEQAIINSPRIPSREAKRVREILME